MMEKTLLTYLSHMCAVTTIKLIGDTIVFMSFLCVIRSCPLIDINVQRGDNSDTYLKIFFVMMHKGY